MFLHFLLISIIFDHLNYVSSLSPQSFSEHPIFLLPLAPCSSELSESCFPKIWDSHLSRLMFPSLAPLCLYDL